MKVARNTVHVRLNQTAKRSKVRKILYGVNTMITALLILSDFKNLKNLYAKEYEPLMNKH